MQQGKMVKTGPINKEIQIYTVGSNHIPRVKGNLRMVHLHKDTDMLHQKHSNITIPKLILST